MQFFSPINDIVQGHVHLLLRFEENLYALVNRYYKFITAQFSADQVDIMREVGIGCEIPHELADKFN